MVEVTDVSVKRVVSMVLLVKLVSPPMTAVNTNI